VTLKSSAEVIQALTLTPDGQRIVSAGRKRINDDYESFIEIWDLNTGEKLHSIKEYSTTESYVCFLAITPDGKQIISGHRDGTIRIWGIPELSL
jgi:WD40 repeat protein